MVLYLSGDLNEFISGIYAVGFLSRPTVCTIFSTGQDTYPSEYLVVKFIFPHLQRYYAGMKISIRTEGNKI